MDQYTGSGPDINGRPLLDSRPDQSVYVHRAREEDAVRSAIGRSLNTLVLGRRGSGKTSFLRALAYILRHEGIPAAFVEGTTTTDAGALVELISRRIGEVSGRAPDGGKVPAGAPLLEAVHGIHSAADPERRMVVLVDGLPSATDAHALFGRLRDELWRLPFTWVVATDDDDRAALLTPP
ncbi:MAG: ATP-binding protein, partial [Actinobacteria bacterium]|nr:ATP-binding protein [Actinomycetota bacterium]